MLSELHKAIASVAPIHGVSVGSWSDKTTWHIDFTDEATPAHRTAALAAIQSFDPSAPANNPVFVPTSVILGRLTEPEYTAIMQAASSQLAAGNGQLAHWLDMARTSTPPGVSLHKKATVDAKAALVAAGLLTAARADEVLSP